MMLIVLVFYVVLCSVCLMLPVSGLSIFDCPFSFLQEEFEDTGGVIRIRKSKNRQHNGLKKKNKKRSSKHTHNAKDRVTRTALKTGGKLRCTGRVSSSCSTSGTRRLFAKAGMLGCITLNNQDELYSRIDNCQIKRGTAICNFSLRFVLIFYFSMANLPFLRNNIHTYEVSIL